MNCWEILALAPTGDVAAIKRAYAAKLKVNRPDDDAQAYQRLRDAYQLALDLAKRGEVDARAGELADAKPDPMVARPPAAVPERDAPLGETPVLPEVTLPLGRSVAQLVEQVLDVWRKQGGDALVNDWPRLQSALFASPLADADQLASAFADLVIGHRSLPALFVDHLRTHFNWQSDFRWQRLFGLARMSKLNARLEFAQLAAKAKREFQSEQARWSVDANLAKSVAEQLRTEADQRHEQEALKQYGHHGPFADFSDHVDAPDLGWLAFMLGPKFARDWLALDREQRSLLKITDPVYASCRETLRKACAIRVGVTIVLALLALGVQLLSKQPLPWVALAVLSGVAVCHCLPIGTLMERLRVLIYPERFVQFWVNPAMTDRRYSRLFSVYYAAMAVVVCLVGQGKTHVNSPGNGPTFYWLVYFFLAACWILAPDRKRPALAMAPPIFLVCFLIVQMEFRWAFIPALAAAACWQAIAYACACRKGMYFISSLWVIGLVCVFFGFESLTLFWLALGLPWFLYELTDIESEAFAMATIGLAILSMPDGWRDMPSAWIGMLCLVLAQASYLMRVFAHRRMSGSGLNVGKFN